MHCRYEELTRVDDVTTNASGAIPTTCKRAAFARFRQLCEAEGEDSDLMRRMKGKSYHQAKRASQAYQHAKHQLHRHFERRLSQRWMPRFGDHKYEDFKDWDITKAPSIVKETLSAIVSQDSQGAQYTAHTHTSIYRGSQGAHRAPADVLKCR